jgi:hypothetical protein
MVARHTRRSNEGRTAAARITTNRGRERHDLLPWADPYIASLMRTHELEKGRARNDGGNEEA